MQALIDADVLRLSDTKLGLWVSTPTMMAILFIVTGIGWLLLLMTVLGTFVKRQEPLVPPSYTSQEIELFSRMSMSPTFENLSQLEKYIRELENQKNHFTTAISQLISWLDMRQELPTDVKRTILSVLINIPGWNNETLSFAPVIRTYDSVPDGTTDGNVGSNQNLDR